MKHLKHLCFTLILIATAALAKAQGRIDEHNIISRLTSIGALELANANQYFIDKKFTLIDKRDVKQPAYTETLYKYRVVGNDDSYLLMEMKGKVVGVGYLTYKKDDKDAAIKTAMATGYVVKQQLSPSEGFEMYFKDNLRLLILTKTANNKTFYIITVSNNALTESLLKG